MSIIKLYRNCKILEEKNFQVDDIESYLATLTPAKTFDNAQYIKMGLDAEVKVTLDQTYLDKQWTNNFNYCSIEMDNGGQDNTYYYFIRKMQWISKDAIKLILHLDVLNTYQGAYKLTDKTTINRMHKDRWEKIEQLPNIGYKQYDFNVTSGWIQHSYQDASLNYHITYSSLNINAIPGYELFQTNFVEHPYFLDNYVCTVTYKLSEIFTEFIRINKSQITTNYDALTGRYYFEIDIDTKSTTSPDLSKYGYPSAVKGNIVLKPVGDDNAKYLQGKVDAVTEDFGDLAKNLKSTTTLYEDDNYPDDKWYLLYRTPDIPTAVEPVDIFLIPNFDYRIGTTTTSTITLNKEYFAPGYDYYITAKDNLGEIVEITAGGTTKRLDDTYLTSGRYVAFCIFRSSTGNQKLTVTGLQYLSNNTNPQGINIDTTFMVTDLDSITIENAYYLRTGEGDPNNNFTSDLDRIQNDFTRSIIGGATGTAVYAKKINEYSLVDPRIMKLIELPYCPINLDVDLDKYVINTADRSIKIKLGAELLNQPVQFDISDVVNINQLAIYDNMKTTDRFLKDPKLLHSSITEIKCCYDNYSKTFSLEECEAYSYASLPEQPLPYEVLVYYKQANTVTSSLSFMFDPLFKEEGNSDYYQYLVSTRNNEKQVYSNQYLDFMRTDYNYARKAQQLQTVNNIVNTTVAGVGGAIAGAQTGGPIGAVIGGVTGAAKGIQNTITSYISSSNAIEQAQVNKKNAPTGVSGSDDLNLFNFYSTNKLQVKVYQPKDYIMNKIDDLFYYYGYKCFNQDIPNTTSRYWFNFIQCDPVYDCDNTTAKISKDQKDELTAKYQQGVTVLHHHTTWDFDQVKENWEIGLVY